MREGTTKDRDMWKDKREAQRGRKREKRWKVKGERPRRETGRQSEISVRLGRHGGGRRGRWGPAKAF